jgi:hypothetical protein
VRVSSELLGVLSRLGLEGHVALLAPYATVEIALVPDRGEAVTVGCSRIGGAPDLPAGVAWPCRRWPLAETNGWPDYARASVDVSRGLGQVWAEGDELVMPIPFLMQLDLERSGPLDRRLPDRGVLSFFASVTSDIDDPLFAKRVAASVAYFDDRVALAPRPHPPTYDNPPARAVRLCAERSIHWHIPYEDMPKLEAALPQAAFATVVADTRREAHALLPAPREECVGPMPPFGEIALLRIHDDPVSDFHVGDASWLTFSISELDLRARRFGEARASVFIG